MSSKSWDAAGVAVAIAQRCNVRILCTRQFQNKISESVYQLLKIQIDRFGLKDQFTFTNNSIKHNTTGAEFLFYGLWRNIDEIKSLEGIDICWIEEAHNLTEEQWKILEPTIRKDGSQFWIIFNPRFATDFVYKRFVRNTPPNSLVRLINYDENGFLNDTALSVIEAARAEDPEEFAHQYLGVPRDNDDTAIIKRTWVMSCIDAHKKLDFGTGTSVAGWDVADDGGDTNAVTVMKGGVVTHVEEWIGDTDELMSSAQRTLSIARDNGCTHVGYDSIGVGAGCGSMFNSLGFRKHYKFNAGGKVHKPKGMYDVAAKIKNEDFFSNIKAQAWWMLAARLRNTHNAVTNGAVFKPEDMISFDSATLDARKLDALIDELCTPRKDFDLMMKVKVESKKDLKKRDIKSPNLADSLIIASVRSILVGASLSDML